MESIERLPHLDLQLPARARDRSGVEARGADARVARELDLLLGEAYRRPLAGTSRRTATDCLASLSLCPDRRGGGAAWSAGAFPARHCLAYTDRRARERRHARLSPARSACG